MDGYIASPDDSMDWAFRHGRLTALADETMNRLDAILASRRWYELADERWNGTAGINDGAFAGPVFVLTHNPPNDGVDRFVSDGIVEEAVATAPPAAGEKDMGIFEASLSRHCLKRRLLDEIVLHIRRCCSAAASGSSGPEATSASSWSACPWARRTG